VDVAENGEEAFQKFKAIGDVSLIISDMDMPVLDGIGLIKKLRAAKHDVPILVLTGNKEVSAAMAAIHAGADDYILKDENIQETIVMHTRKVFEKRRILDEMKSLNAQLNVRNNFILKTFGRYMSTEVVEKLLESPDGLKLGGEALVVTVLMSDLRGFSNFTAKMAPEAVVSMLNGYFDEMTSIIFKYFGTINEIIGDALLVLFGAPQSRPDDPDLALACALEMQLAMGKVNSRNKELGFPTLEMGIGITTGRVIVGNIGSDMRVKYAVVGESVNLAGRIESFTVGGQVLVSEATLQASSLQVRTRNKFSVAFKGFDAPINIYEALEVSGKFNVSLPETQVVHIPLAEEIAVLFDVFDGKVSSGEMYKGRISSLASKHAILENDNTGRRSADAQLIKVHSNLKIVLPFNDGMGKPAEIYVKVVQKLGASKFEVRFTSISEEVNAMLESPRTGVTM
jgi:adenylate cyclase